jgi:hypothetical protein
MSEMGQSHHFDHAPITSGLTRKADRFKAGGHFAKVPNTDVGSACLKKMFTEAQRPLPLVSGGALHVWSEWQRAGHRPGGT